MISNFMKLSQQQLYDTANYYLDRNTLDIALICFSIIINTPAKETNVELQKRIIDSYIKAAKLYYGMCDYRRAFDLYIKALLNCEKGDFVPYEIRIHNNIGNIYHRFKKYDIAMVYLSKALSLSQDSVSIVYILNNLGAVELDNDNPENAFQRLNEALHISRKNNNVYMAFILNNIAYYYQKQKIYDSASYYYYFSLDIAKENNQTEIEADLLSSLGNLYSEIGKQELALSYMYQSNEIALKNNFPEILARNYLNLSNIEEMKGNIPKAFDYYKKHTNVKDSIHNIEVFGDINQLQRLYEVSKTNQQIEQLIVEKQIKERTIYYQKVIWIITLFVLVLVSIGLLIIYLQKRNLSRAYQLLFEKNIEILDYDKSSTETYIEKYRKSALKQEMQEDLLNKILSVMEEVAIFCDTDFTIDKLAELVQSNQKYVSQVINGALKKNFRTFVNSYKIKEAQRIFSEPDAGKFTIESVALKIGFKSRSAFDDAFKEITGVSPSFYLKAIQEQNGL